MDSLLSWSGPLAIGYTICAHTLNVSFVRERWILGYIFNSNKLENIVLWLLQLQTE